VTESAYFFTGRRLLVAEGATETGIFLASFRRQKVRSVNTGALCVARLVVEIKGPCREIRRTEVVDMRRINQGAWKPTLGIEGIIEGQTLPDALSLPVVNVWLSCWDEALRGSPKSWTHSQDFPGDAIEGVAQAASFAMDGHHV